MYTPESNGIEAEDKLQKPNLRLMASARGRRSARYVAMEREEREEEEDEEASDSGSDNSVSSDLGS